MTTCEVCGKEIDNHSYLIEDSPTFYTHCFACSFALLIAKERGTTDERCEQKY